MSSTKKQIAERTERQRWKHSYFFAETQTWGSADSNKSVGTCYNEKEKNNDYLCRKRLQWREQKSSQHYVCPDYYETGRSSWSATGSTPVGMYKQLIEWYKKGDLDFAKVTSVNLDEYKGLSGDNDQSYRYFMNTNLFDHVNIDKTKTYVPNGLEEDSEKACADYNAITAV